MKASMKRIQQDVKTSICCNTHTNGDDVLREYEVRTGSRIDLMKLGFTSVFDLIANLSDIMGLRRLANGQFILYDRENPPESAASIAEDVAADSCGSEHQQRTLSKETIGRLRQLVEVEYPEGLAIEELVGAYRFACPATCGH
ncbi:uncharacterized protein LOC122246013 [Penaeus japonicus]|uniref:uncharacterized protein LOC122246013 n=1 Tax=Penaeus japonicus TaxID=27405 RepID=UPI001C7153B0|nr:uncharacterized protein LOC122246013 [Penaeus japonicus]